MAGHSHGPTSGNKFWLALAVTVTFTLTEAVAGTVTRSLALTSDAGHNFTDALALGLAAYAVWIGKRPASSKYTYGYHRVAILTALLNAATLLVVAAVIGTQSYQRILHPAHVGGTIMIAVAGIGLIINSAIAIGLASEAKNSLNAKAAFVHMAGDAVSSLAVVIAGILVHYWGWIYADPIVSIFIAVIILVSGIGIIREAISVLMESVPEHVDVDELIAAIKSVELVRDVHDLHIWKVGDGMNFLSCHVTLPVVCTLEDSTVIVNRINAKLHNDFHIVHSTIQSEPVGCCKIEDSDNIYCALTASDQQHARHCH
jgi:cobalt-zinc-cadmium efflux system protein